MFFCIIKISVKNISKRYSIRVFLFFFFLNRDGYFFFFFSLEEGWIFFVLVFRKIIYVRSEKNLSHYERERKILLRDVR